LNVDTIQSRIDRLRAQKDTASACLMQERIAFKESKRNLRDAEHVRSKAQAVAQAIQEQVHARIAQVVTTCLHTVFGEDAYEFRIKFVQKRGRTEAQLVFLKDGNEIDNPIEEDSGGVVQIAAFALRLSCLMLSRPRPRRFLVLDEPFPHVSAQFRPAVRQMMKQLAEDFDMQFLIVTHEPQYMMGKVIQL